MPNEFINEEERRKIFSEAAIRLSERLLCAEIAREHGRTIGDNCYNHENRLDVHGVIPCWELIARNIEAPELRPVIHRTVCTDCGIAYQQGAPHRLFCKARICSLCDELSDHVLPLVDGVRLCEICKEA